MESCIATIIASTAVFLNIICSICLLMYCKAFPDVIRLQVMSISMSYTLRASYLIYKSICGMIYSTGIYIEPVERTYCVIDIFFYVVTHQVNQVSLMWLGLDRLYVSFRGKSMISGLSSTAIISNVLLIWILSIVFYIFCVFYGNMSFHQRVCFCVASTAVPISPIYSLMTFSMISVQMFNCAMYMFLIFWSKRQLDQFGRSTSQNLDDRFMLWSNFTAGR
uniref:G-protein coupled receptors family 1 profile domain-containing protein n=1 Tax=Romanomermis culicivorax TaxID=13658 RepID=A0A915HFJ3_ROMCU